ncbi:hypothetical protein GGQ99_000974 [Aminobacter niigataensis]|uniref:Uncharacterized protein n=1 Tax=Aminobacter niigataensis TaxID=83265 RepID=A0ABR6KXK4_9HYPH|nr:hypothetical protein [Aminobacter niigataensis]MBB4649252.1 hypothetical protein [Aminobacter niigataensis]
MTNKGQEEAHTPAAPGAEAPSSALPGADPLDLLDGSPDLDALDLLALAAEPALSQRRARGRPQGALNRKNADMIAYLKALGHRDPWVTLSTVQSADTMKLALALRSPVMKNGKQLVSKAGTPLFNTPSPMDVLALQMRAADALMPYHHAKKPQQLDLGDLGDKRPVMVIGEMNVAIANDYGIMSAGIAPGADMQGNQGLSEGEAVRDGKVISHDEPK